MRRRSALVLPLVALLGCAAARPSPRAADYPFHATQPPLFILHWRLDREDGTVTAIGLAELSMPDRLDAAVLELQGLDREGRVVSYGAARIQPRAFAGDAAWPFSVRLRARGEEARFTLRVSQVTWRVTPDGM